MSSPISEKLRHKIPLIEPEALGHDVWHILAEQHFKGVLPPTAVKHLCEKYQLTPQAFALKLLPMSTAYSHAPISEYHVGAIAIGVSGHFYFGANLEFTQTHIQQTVHAEQSAISHAWMNKERAITDVVVNYTPCGHCRQFMNELKTAPELKVHLPHSQNNLLHDYLPDSFGPAHLDISHYLLDEHDNQLTYPTEDPLVLSALEAANAAHAPYSKAYHGVAIETYDKRIYQGSYAENVAFNPSLPALQVAINHLLLSGDSLDNIRHIVMIEKASPLSYRKMSEALLEGLLGSYSFEYILL
ncbi:cytidine deaminase [Pasteurella sp. PK-2025]|uniref:cytidine deaminase n=1 Tax=unclassified Pasteurella TaxID=2621516 RepID=UPI003C76B94B